MKKKNEKIESCESIKFPLTICYDLALTVACSSMAYSTVIYGLPLWQHIIRIVSSLFISDRCIPMVHSLDSDYFPQSANSNCN